MPIMYVSMLRHRDTYLSQVYVGMKRYMSSPYHQTIGSTPAVANSPNSVCNKFLSMSSHTMGILRKVGGTVQFNGYL